MRGGNLKIGKKDEVSMIAVMEVRTDNTNYSDISTPSFAVVDFRDPNVAKRLLGYIDCFKKFRKTLPELEFISVSNKDCEFAPDFVLDLDMDTDEISELFDFNDLESVLNRLDDYYYKGYSYLEVFEHGINWAIYDKHTNDKFVSAFLYLDTLKNLASGKELSEEEMKTLTGGLPL